MACELNNHQDGKKRRPMVKPRTNEDPLSPKREKRTKKEEENLCRSVKSNHCRIVTRNVRSSRLQKTQTKREGGERGEREDERGRKGR